MRPLRLWLIAPSAPLALLLAACGAAQTSTVPPMDAMAGMDQTSMPGMSATAAPASDSMAGMDQGGSAADGQPYDALFIDRMIVHHEGAITMANQALEQAERPEITTLANAIITAQQAEIAQLQTWRTLWYPDLAETTGMDMGSMEVPVGDAPFDQRFIQAMIPHHQSAITMAQDALQNAERPEIKDLAQAIITAQEGEIAQMRQWLQEWYGITQ